MNYFEILEWDSVFFGFRVARMTSNVTLIYVPTILKALVEQEVQLVYWAVEPPMTDIQHSILKLGGVFVDKKVTFMKTLMTTPPAIPSAIAVTSYDQTVMTVELSRLAIQAGLFSRFQVDPRIGYDKFAALYQLWMEKSIRRELAEDVLVIHDDTRSHRPIIGVATVGQKNGRGDIGLVAVDGQYRGRGLARALMHATDQWFYQHHYRTAQVVTQGDNTVACHLYAKAGYTIDHVEWLYHYWVDIK